MYTSNFKINDKDISDELKLVKMKLRFYYIIFRRYFHKTICKIKTRKCFKTINVPLHREATYMLKYLTLHSTTADTKDPVDCLSSDLDFMWRCFPRAKKLNLTQISGLYNL